MYPFTFIFGGTSKFLGVQSLTLHLGVQRNLTAFSPHKVVHHAVFCKYYAELHVPPDEKTCGHSDKNVHHDHCETTT
jgi:hypothetical protein